MQQFCVQRELYKSYTVLTDLMLYENINQVFVCFIFGHNKHAIVNGQCLFFIISILLSP